MPAAARYRLSEGYGAVLMLLGRYPEASEQLGGTIELAEDAERKARIEALQGELVFKQGSLDRSIALYEDGLRRLGHWVPRGRIGLAYGLVRESVIQCAHSLRPGRLHREPPSSRGDLAVRFLYRLANAHAFRLTPKALWYHLAGMNLSESLPLSQHVGVTYAYHGCITSMLGWLSRGNRYGDRAVAVAREFDNFWELGECCNYSGIGHYASALYEEGLAQLTKAIEFFDKAGDLWELNMAHFHKGCCHFGLGDLAEAIAEWRWAFAASVRLGDSRTMCSSYLWRGPRGGISRSRSCGAASRRGRTTSC